MHETQNNGKIASQTDAISGETVVYTYDALNRLAARPKWEGRRDSLNRALHFRDS